MLEKEAEVQEAGAPKPRARWKLVLGVLGIVLVLAASTAGGGAYYVYRSLQPAPAGEARKVTIPPGTGSSGIAGILEKEGIIRKDWAFMAYLRYKKAGSRFQAGLYELKPGMKLDEIIDKLNRGDVVKEEMLHFTIPEGFTVVQMADKLSKEAIVNRDSFLKLADSADASWPMTRADGIPKSTDYKHRLEGYLFPETYEMKKGSTEADILNRMLGEWDNKLKELPGWEDQLAKTGLTFHQALTVASLVEREVAVEDERARVAGVIYNRIKLKMPLQIDASIQYLFDKQKDRLMEKDLQIESPYNTYLHAGLPPGPIASPGLSSLKAALWPEENKYLFYVTKKDGSGRHLFAETFEEHKKNIASSKTAP